MHLSNHHSFYRKSLTVLILTLSLLISGCSFHLKHNNGLVEKFPEIYLQTKDPTGELARLVKLRLRGANIKILSEPSDNVAVLALESEQRSSRTISLYANALNAEKEIGYTLNYSLKMPRYTAKNFTVNIYRDFLDDSSEALAKSRETELITKELRVIAADHIITSMLSMKNEAVE
jgi:LPS-assembly lipoprotein